MDTSSKTSAHTHACQGKWGGENVEARGGTADGFDRQNVLQALRVLLSGSSLVLRRLGCQFLSGRLLWETQLPPSLPLILLCWTD